MATDRWFFPTSTDNLKAILSHGLICGSAGYKKYYVDISSDFPGFIPIFRNGSGGHGDALIKAREEADDLVVCLLEIHLPQIVSGNVYLPNNDIIDINSCKNNYEDDPLDTILLPSPLPLSCIKQVIFESLDVKKTFEDDVKCYGDTPQGVLKLVAATNKSDKNLFKRNTQISVAPITANVSKAAGGDFEQKVPSKNTVNFNKVYSLGGLLCTLFYFTKNGSITNNFFADCTRLEKRENTDNTLASGINDYFYPQGEHTKDSNPQMMILHNVLNILIEHKSRECISAIVNFLQAEESFNRPNERTRAKELSGRLSGFYHNTTDSKASTLFASSSSKVEKALLLLAHRDDVTGLIGTDIADLEVFNEEDYIIAAMLFGIRSKYYKIPISIRQYAGIHEYISNLMAQYTHTVANSGIVFKKTPAPTTVMEMINPKSKKSNWLGFIQWLSKKYSIQSCFQTTMPNKQFTNDKGKSTYDGIVLPDIEIKETEYFNVMSKISIDDNGYETISKKYKSV